MAFGCFNHYALVPATDQALVGMWFALSFGLQQVHALLALDTVALSPQPDPADVEIRHAGAQDRPLLEELSDLIWRHQVKAPVWGIHLSESEAETRIGWGEL